MSTVLNRFVLAAAGCAALVFTGIAAAQYTGPTGTTASMSVKQILDDPRDDQKVTVRGHLLRQIDDDEYIFSDGTGEIVVEIDDDDFPRGETVDERTVVELFGEVDVDNRRDPEIEVDNVRIISRR